MKRLLPLLTAIVLLLAACGPASATQTLVVASPTHNGLYNPLYAATDYDQDVCNLVYEGLVNLQPDGIAKVNNVLVNSLHISPDGLTYTFQLNSRVKLSDGTPLTADDVVFTYQTLADPSSTAYRHHWAKSLEGGTAYMNGESTDFPGVQAEGKHKVVFRFAENRRSNLERAGLKILSKAHYPDWEYGQADFAMHEKMATPLGSGPYVLTDLTAGQDVTLKKNPKYWADQSQQYQIGEIQIRFLSDEEAAQGLKDGTVHLVPQRHGIQELMADIPDVKIQSHWRNSYGFFGFNTANGDTSNVALRQAIATIFDRIGFVNEYFGKEGVIATAPIPPSSDLYKLIARDIDVYSYDYDQAVNSLMEAGYQWKGPVLCYQDHPVEVTFLATKDNRTVEELVPRLEEVATKLGFQLTVEEVSFATLLDTIQSPEQTDWDMFFMTDDWRGDDPNQWARYFSSESDTLTNVTRYHSPKVDRLLAEGRSYPDAYDKEALAIYREVLLELNHDLPELPLYSNTLHTYTKGVEGVEVGPYQRWSEGMVHATFS